ncbi:MAG: ribonuclease P protein component 4 [Candidatus Woesearchaeota archaeon]
MGEIRQNIKINPKQSKQDTFKKKQISNRSKKKSFQSKAQSRINELFCVADDFLKIDKKYANNCMRLARKISLRYKVSFTREQKMKYCKRCNSYLSAGNTARVRVSRGKVVVLCFNCKTIARYLYK